MLILIIPPTHGMFGAYCILIVVLSFLFSISHPTYSALLKWVFEIKSCEKISYLFYQIGVYNIFQMNYVDAVRILLPDIIIFLISLLIGIHQIKRTRKIKFTNNFNKIKRYKMNPSELSTVPSGESLGSQATFGWNKVDSTKSLRMRTQIWTVWMYQRIKVVSNLIILCLSGIISPSVLNLTYYNLNIIVWCVWASGKKITSDGLFLLRTFLLTYSALHLILIYLSQIECIRDMISNYKLIDSLLGLHSFVQSTCLMNGEAMINDNKLYNIFNPFILSSLYYANALNIKVWLDKQTLHNLALMPTFPRRLATSASESNNNIMRSFDIHQNIDRPFISSVFLALVRNSYVITFIAMMTWSITYKSWMTFMFLITACVLWLMPDSRKACLYTSPFIVAYAILLNIMNYAFNIHPNNAIFLFKYYTGIEYINGEIGLFIMDVPFVPLLLTNIYLMIFLMTLKLYTKEQKKSKAQITRIHSALFNDNTLYTMLKSLIVSLCDTYWIMVCGLVLLLGATQNEVKIFTILYLVLFIYFSLLFMTNYHLWRLQLYIFWWIVIIYSLTIVLFIYTYTFSMFNGLWKLIGFSEDQLIKIGLKGYKKVVIYEGMIIPVVLLIVTIIQIRYFHENFLMHARTRRSSSTQTSSKNDSYDSVLERPSFIIAWSILISKFKKEHRVDDFIPELNMRVTNKNYRELIIKSVMLVVQKITFLLWTVAEAHFGKIVIISLTDFITSKVNAYNVVFVMLIIIFIPFGIDKRFLIIILYILLCFHIMVQSVYQMELIEVQNVNCSINGEQYLIFGDQVFNIPEYFGIKITDMMRNDNKKLIIAMVCCIIWFVIYYHQKLYYLKNGLKRPEQGIIFPNFQITQFNGSLLSCIKYCLNFAFYRLGLEMCFICIVINACYRLDVFSIFYLIILLVFLLSSRETCSKLWPIYIFTLSVLIPLQYLICIGFIPTLCKEYWIVVEKALLSQYLFIPNYKHPPSGWKIFGDFMQLLFALSQMKVFITENSDVGIKGGLNRPIHMNELPGQNEKDFMSSKESYMDYIQHFIFQGIYWLSLTIMFITGLFINTIFCFGYIIITCVFFWIGHRLVVKKRKYLIYSWNFILYYNYLVILSKCLLQIVSCNFVNNVMNVSGCWLIKLFGIQCLDSYKRNLLNTAITIGQCKGKPHGFTLDVLCFITIILQRRIFSTKGFCFVVLDKIVSHSFASRGGFLISRKLMSALIEERINENNLLMRIKVNIQNIEKKYASYGRPLPNEHYLILRSGDYFLFDEIKQSDSEESFGLIHDSSSGGRWNIDLSEYTRTEKSMSLYKGSVISSMSQINKTFKEIEEEETEILQAKLFSKMSKYEKDDSFDDQYEDIPEVIESSQTTQSKLDSIFEPIDLFTEVKVNPSHKLIMSDVLQLPHHSKFSHGSYETYSDSADNSQNYSNIVRVRPPQHMTNSSRFQLRSQVERLSVKRETSEDISIGSISDAMTFTEKRKKQFISSLELEEINRKKYMELQMIDTIYDLSEKSEDEPKIKRTFSETRKVIFKKIKKYINIGIDYLIRKINLMTKDIRNVRKMLNSEKLIIKKRIITFSSGNWLETKEDSFHVLTNDGNQALSITTYVTGVLVTTADIWKVKYRCAILESLDLKIFERLHPTISNNSNTVNNNALFHEEIVKQKQFLRNVPRLFRLFLAISNFITIHSDFVCYTTMILNHMLSHSMISIVYPLSVFLWAMLSVPRPSTFYWLFIIIYTQLAIIVKYIYRFDFFSLSTVYEDIEQERAMYWPRYIGIEDQNVTTDLLQLLVLFLHRDYLKSHGLWKGQKKNLFSNQPKWKMIFTPFYNIKSFLLTLCGTHQNKKVNLYTYIFACEFISFFILFFGYTYLGFSLTIGQDRYDLIGADNAGRSGFDFIKSNKLPMPFVGMLMTQFLFFILERILFLRKEIIGKLLFLIFHVFLIHVWLFFLIPYISDQKFNSSLVPQIFYFFKCVYFALSAYQIKSGYPLRILGNFLTKNYNYINLFLFKGYLLVPFLYELRNVMDWMWTDTTLSLFNWMEVEDVFTKIFMLKCWRRAELEYPTRRGEKMWFVTKYLVGILLMFLFMSCLWAPLFVSAFISNTYVHNPPILCELVIQLGTYDPLYRYSAESPHLLTLPRDDFDFILNCCNRDKRTSSFLKSVSNSDITEAIFGATSRRLWDVSPYNLNELLRILNDTNSKLKLNFHMKCSRGHLSKDTPNVDIKYTQSVVLKFNQKASILRVLNGETDTFILNKTLTKFLWATSNSMASITRTESKNMCNSRPYLTLKFTFHNESDSKFWSIEEQYRTGCFNNIKARGPGPYLFIISERVPSNIFGQLFNKYGILGMYAAYIFVVHRLMRSVYFDLSYIINLNELPNVDRILNLLNDIYMVRENKMFILEEQLVAKLIFLYRSAETMIKFTRHSKSTISPHMDNI